MGRSLKKCIHFAELSPSNECPAWREILLRARMSATDQGRSWILSSVARPSRMEKARMGVAA